MFRAALTLASASFGLIIGIGVGAAFGTIVSLSAYFYHSFNESLWLQVFAVARKKIPKFEISFQKEDQEDAHVS